MSVIRRGKVLSDTALIKSARMIHLAYELGTAWGKPMYTVNPTNVDELKSTLKAPISAA